MTKKRYLVNLNTRECSKKSWYLFNNENFKKRKETLKSKKALCLSNLSNFGKLNKKSIKYESLWNKWSLFVASDDLTKINNFL